MCIVLLYSSANLGRSHCTHTGITSSTGCKSEHLSNLETGSETLVAEQRRETDSSRSNVFLSNKHEPTANFLLPVIPYFTTPGSSATLIHKRICSPRGVSLELTQPQTFYASIYGAISQTA